MHSVLNILMHFSIVDIMAEELKWDRKEKERQFKEASEFIDVEMGQMARCKAMMEASINLTHEEIAVAKKKFQQLDKDRRGTPNSHNFRR